MYSIFCRDRVLFLIFFSGLAPCPIWPSEVTVWTFLWTSDWLQVNFHCIHSNVMKELFLFRIHCKWLCIVLGQFMQEFFMKLKIDKFTIVVFIEFFKLNINCSRKWQNVFYMQVEILCVTVTKVQISSWCVTLEWWVACSTLWRIISWLPLPSGPSPASSQCSSRAPQTRGQCSSKWGNF